MAVIIDGQQNVHAGCGKFVSANYVETRIIFGRNKLDDVEYSH
jgi:hypothetical protein